MDEEKCECGAVLNDETKCSCQPDKCKKCCTCADDCECGCKSVEKEDVVADDKAEDTKDEA